MIRTLVIIAVASFVLCIGCIAGAFAIAGGPFAIRDWAVDHWTGEGEFRNGHWSFHESGDAGPETSREFAFSADHFEVGVPAEIEYVQDPAARMVVTGPKALLDRLALTDGRLDLTGQGFAPGRAHIVISAPAVGRFQLAGAQTLKIEKFDQPLLRIAISGSADVTGEGRADTVEVDITGSGRADLEDLKSKAAKAEISGSGAAVISPQDKADIRVSGDGRVELTTRPADVHTEITGSGEVEQQGN